MQDNGETAKTHENRDESGNMMSVEISVDDGEREMVWTYYRHKDDCTATIEREHAVRSELK
jgi:major membrane immunogen (membrane-anchored lipoprotein)